MAMQAAGAKEVAVTLVKAGVSHSLATAVVNVQAGVYAEWFVLMPDTSPSACFLHRGSI